MEASIARVWSPPFFDTQHKLAHAIRTLRSPRSNGSGFVDEPTELISSVTAERREVADHGPNAQRTYGDADGLNALRRNQDSSDSDACSATLNVHGTGG